MTTLRRRKRGSNWFLDTRVGNRRVRITTGTRDKSAATMFLADYERKRLLGVVDNYNQTPRISDLFLRYYRYLDGHWSRPNCEITRLQNWLTYFNRIGIKHPMDITKAHIDGFLFDDMAESADATKNRYVGILRSCLYHSVDRGYIPDNPIRRYRLLKVKKRVSFFPDEQIRDLIDGAADDMPLQNCILIAAYTGARLGEILHQRWCDVKFSEPPEMNIVNFSDRSGRDARRVVEFGTKNLKNRAIPINQTVLLPLFRRLKIDEGGVYVVRHHFETDEGILRSHRPSDRFSTLRKRLGIERGSFHWLRHSFATQLLRAGTPIAVVQKLLGHSGIAITVNTYGHLTASEGRGSVDALCF